MNMFDYSIYIPRIRADYTEIMIREKLNYVGFVKYVDFAPINPGNGFGNKEKIIGEFQCAFVHLLLEPWNPYVVEMLSYLNHGQRFTIWIHDKEYWLILENHNPIPRTWMNIHQVVDNCRLLELQVAGCLHYSELQDNKIAYLEEKMKKQEEQLKHIYVSLAEIRLETSRHNKSDGITRRDAGHEEWKEMPIV